MFKSTEEWGKGVSVANPGRFSALAVRVARYLIWPLVRVLFRPRLYGIENLPQRGPFLLVPRMIGLKRWGLSLPGLLGAAAILAWVPWAIEWRALLVWLWLGSPLVFLPIIPWRINMRIGDSFQIEELDAHGEMDEARQLHVVERRIESLLTAPRE